MNTREIASEYRLTQWAQITRERADRGLSVRAYCKEIGIHENTYFYWQEKIRKPEHAWFAALAFTIFDELVD